MKRGSRSQNNSRLPDYLLFGSEWDIATEEALAFSAEERCEYLVSLLTEIQRLMRRKQGVTLKKRVPFRNEMAALRRLVRTPTDPDRNSYLRTDDIHTNRDALATNTPAHSEHTYWAQYATWRMVTKHGDLRGDVVSVVRAARKPPKPSAKKRKKSLMDRLDDLLDGRKKSKAQFRLAHNRVLPMLYSYLQTQYNLRTAFPPFHAKFFADRYLPHDRDSIVVDPCAGWGGRLIGTLCVKRSHRVSYYATDPNERLQDAYAGLTRRATIWLKRDIQAPRVAKVFPRPFENWIRTKSARRLYGKVDMVMTSPPYFSAEVYDTSLKQSARHYDNYELWCEKFYRPLIQGAFDLLRPNGVFVLNVANVQEARGLERDGLRIAKECGFRWNEYFRLLMPKTVGTRKGENIRPTKAKRSTRKKRRTHETWVDGRPFKHEPVMCFVKPIQTSQRAQR
jgi:hypothetical protein